MPQPCCIIRCGTKTAEFRSEELLPEWFRSQMMGDPGLSPRKQVAAPPQPPVADPAAAGGRTLSTSPKQTPLHMGSVTGHVVNLWLDCLRCKSLDLSGAQTECYMPGHAQAPECPAGSIVRQPRSSAKGKDARAAALTRPSNSAPVRTRRPHPGNKTMPAKCALGCQANSPTAPSLCFERSG